MRGGIFILAFGFVVILLIPHLIALEKQEERLRPTLEFHTIVHGVQDETKIEIERTSPEIRNWIGNAVERCLSTPDCRFVRDENRVAFYGLNAPDLISIAPQGVSIQFDAADFQTEPTEPGGR